MLVYQNVLWMNPHQDLLVQTLHLLSHLWDVNTIDYSYKLLMMIIIIISITKFSIMTGFLCAYLSRNQYAITRVSNYRHPISTCCNWISVIGYPHDLHINYTHCNGFSCSVSYIFQNLGRALCCFCSEEVLRRHF